MNPNIKLRKGNLEGGEHLELEPGGACQIFISPFGMVEMTCTDLHMLPDDLDTLIEALQMAQRQQKELCFLSRRVPTKGEGQGNS